VTTPQPLPEALITTAVELLLAGQVIGLPTETVYGLAADGTNPTAVRRIFELKGRPSGHPLILHLGAIDWLDRYASRVPERARTLAARFWPGPLTLVLPRSAYVPDAVTGGMDTVALRMPRHPVALQVLQRLDRPLAAPSANLFGRVSPTTRAHVEHDFGANVPLVLEGGATEQGVESTILDLTTATPRLLRHGGLSKATLEAALGEPIEELLHVRPAGIVAPGMLESHYAPEAPLVLCTPEALVKTTRDLMRTRREEVDASSPHVAASTGGGLGLLAHGVALSDLSSLGELQEVGHLPDLPHATCARLVGETPCELVFVSGGVENAARAVYGALRYLDERRVSCIVASLPSDEGIGRAVRDRLHRAAAPRSPHQS
jgi:L-threonylcarbamoyladenylate synthase